jgi:hypothetical protein
VLTIQSRLSPPVPDVSMDGRPHLTGLISYTGSVPAVGSFVRELSDSLVSRAGTRIGQLIVKRCDQKQLRGCFDITHRPRHRPYISRLSPVILVSFFRRLGIHAAEPSREIL